MTTPSNPYQAPTSDISNVPGFDGEDQSSPFSPSGRFGRLSYIAWGMLLSFAFGVIAFVIAGGAAIFSDPTAMASPIAIVLQVISVVPAIIFAIRRLHDFNASGWWSAVMIVPVANAILVLVLLFKGGNDGPNRFGPPRVTRGWEKVLGYIAIVLGVIGLIALAGILMKAATA